LTEPTAWLDVFLDVPAAVAADVRAFWAAVTGWAESTPRGDRGQFRSLLPPVGRACLRVQELAEAPRVHVDLMSHDQAEDGDRLEHLGATRVMTIEDMPILRSPGGQVLCLVCDDEPRPPVPLGDRAAVWADGHRSRLTHICLDVAPEAYDVELAFWSAATGWTPGPASRPEYAFLTPPNAGSDTAPALRLLLQRLDRPGEGPRAHLDIGTDDIPAEVGRLLDLGAEDVGPVATWHVLRDPVVGWPFCVTDQRP
jgi:Glyoxalase-like domain